MAKYRKKPIVIDAEQWHVWKTQEGVCMCDDPHILTTERRRDASRSTEGDGYPHIHTLEGPLSVSPGDWIIKGVNGEYYPCKPDIFDKTYEAVPDKDEVKA